MLPQQIRHARAQRPARLLELGGDRLRQQRARQRAAHREAVLVRHRVVLPRGGVAMGGEGVRLVEQVVDVGRDGSLGGGSPSVLGPLLNEYLTGMTDIVFSHEGTVAKIVGEPFMRSSARPAKRPTIAHAPLPARWISMNMPSHSATLSEKRHPLGITRIGAHAGPAIVGNFGGGRFFDYTAYGDTVNVAARLEAANKYFGSHVCVVHFWRRK